MFSIGKPEGISPQGWPKIGEKSLSTGIHKIGNQEDIY